METSEVLELFASPLKESWSEQSVVVAYHGGVAIVTEEPFDSREDSPKLESISIGDNTPNGTYYFRHEISSPRGLYAYRVRVYQDGHPNSFSIEKGPIKS